MTTKRFEELFEEEVQRCRDVLIVKAKEYASEDDDRLHNFRLAAGMLDCSMQEALLGMLTKHLISVVDICKSGKEYSRDLVLEKITDSLNYFFLLNAVDVEVRENNKGERNAL